MSKWVIFGGLCAVNLVVYVVSNKKARELNEEIQELESETAFLLAKKEQEAHNEEVQGIGATLRNNRVRNLIL